MAKRLSQAERARKERCDQAEKMISDLHPKFTEIIFSFFEVDLICDVKDAKGEWHRYVHRTDDPTDAVILGGV